MHFGITGCFGGLDGLTFQDHVEFAQTAERLGYESIWLNEEHFVAEDRLCLAPIPLASYLAGRTESLRLGFSVIQLPVHDPLRLAEDIATLDVLSGGRVDFGVSRSGNDRYHRGFGIPREERTERFNEALGFIQKYWTANSPIDHHGRFYHYENVVSSPKPIQRPHPPIYIGARQPESVRRVAEGGHRLIGGVIQTLSYTVEDITTFREAARETQRALVPEDITIGRFVFLAETDARAREEAKPVIAGLAENFRRGGLLQTGYVVNSDQLDLETFQREIAIVGSPETCAVQIEQLARSLGFGRFNCGFGFSGIAQPEQVQRSFRLFGEQVIAGFGRGERDPVG